MFIIRKKNSHTKRKFKMPNEKRTDIGVDNIEVKLLNYTVDPMFTMYTFIMSTWGDLVTNYSGIKRSEIERVVNEALDGKRFAGQVLECVNYTFAISNVSRACTHQIVRTRIGAGFGQQGGRDNYWGDFNFRMPNSVANNPAAKMAFQEAVLKIRRAYDEAYKNGIPYQDARFICPIGLETNIVETINLRALSTLLQNRLCNAMQWEINTVARKMKYAVIKVHPEFEKILKPMCEKLGKCVAKPTLFPPCGKYPMSKEQLEKKDKNGYEFPHHNNGNVILGRVHQDRRRLGFEI